jgi:hypothetical protein
MKIIVSQEAMPALTQLFDSALRGAGMLLTQGGLQAMNAAIATINTVTEVQQAVELEKSVDKKE